MVKLCGIQPVDTNYDTNRRGSHYNCLRDSPEHLDIMFKNKG